MNEFRTTKLGISAKFDSVAARLLSQLATQLAELLAEREGDSSDDAVKRLLPAGYLGAEDDAQEFRRLTESDLADGKIRSALELAELLKLESFGAIHDNVTVTLDHDGATEWARTINDIRLVLGVRLGVTEYREPVLDDAEVEATYEVFKWLGNLQYSLVRALDK